MRTHTFFRWLGSTVLWALASCAAVAVIWGPNPQAMLVTAGVSALASLLLGNGVRS